VSGRIAQATHTDPVSRSAADQDVLNPRLRFPEAISAFYDSFIFATMCGLREFNTVGPLATGVPLSMIKLLLVTATGLTLLSANAASAQSESQCQQVRAAVAQYGYKAAKAHAQATMSPQAVRAADSCVRGHSGAKSQMAMRKRHRLHRIAR